MATLSVRGLPLAAADTIEWGTRRLDIFILGLFAAPTAVGVYYVAQQVASLPQKLKTSFEPILGPVLTRKLKEKDYAAIAKQVCQVGFWITAAQAGVGLALGIPRRGDRGSWSGRTSSAAHGALGFLLLAEVVAAYRGRVRSRAGLRRPAAQPVDLDRRHQPAGRCSRSARC